MYYLIKFQSDYADEFDVYGFQIMNEKDYKRFQNTLKEYEKYLNINENSLEYYFGTNESITWESFDDLIKSITISGISAEKTDFLIEQFGDSWGASIPTDLMDYV